MKKIIFAAILAVAGWAMPLNAEIVINNRWAVYGHFWDGNPYVTDGGVFSIGYTVSYGGAPLQNCYTYVVVDSYISGTQYLDNQLEDGYPTQFYYLGSVDHWDDGSYAYVVAGDGSGYVTDGITPTW